MYARWILLLAAVLSLTFVSGSNAASVSKSQREAVIFVADMRQGDDLERAFYEFVSFSAVSIAQTAMTPLYSKVTTIKGSGATLSALVAALKTAAAKSSITAVDLVLATHGLSGEIVFAEGRRSMSEVRSAITNNLSSSQRAKLRMVFSTACFGSSHRTNWTNAGFKTVSGSQGIYADSATSYAAFLGAWIAGAKFSDAVALANASDPLRVSDNAAKAWFTSRGRLDRAGEVNSQRQVGGSSTLTINSIP